LFQIYKKLPNVISVYKVRPLAEYAHPPVGTIKNVINKPANKLTSRTRHKHQTTPPPTPRQQEKVPGTFNLPRESIARNICRSASVNVTIYFFFMGGLLAYVLYTIGKETRNNPPFYG
jgi:hypothetical protein